MRTKIRIETYLFRRLVLAVIVISPNTHKNKFQTNNCSCWLQATGSPTVFYRIDVILSGSGQKIMKYLKASYRPYTKFNNSCTQFPATKRNLCMILESARELSLFGFKRIDAVLKRISKLDPSCSCKHEMQNHIYYAQTAFFMLSMCIHWVGIMHCYGRGSIVAFF